MSSAGRCVARTRPGLIRGGSSIPGVAGWTVLILWMLSAPSTTLPFWLKYFQPPVLRTWWRGSVRRAAVHDAGMRRQGDRGYRRIPAVSPWEVPLFDVATIPSIGGLLRLDSLESVGGTQAPQLRQLHLTRTPWRSESRRNWPHLRLMKLRREMAVHAEMAVRGDSRLQRWPSAQRDGCPHRDGRPHTGHRDMAVNPQRWTSRICVHELKKHWQLNLV